MRLHLVGRRHGLGLVGVGGQKSGMTCSLLCFRKLKLMKRSIMTMVYEFFIFYCFGKAKLDEFGKLLGIKNQGCM